MSQDLEQIRALLEVQTQEFKEVKKAVMDLCISRAENDAAHNCILEKLGDVKESVKGLTTNLDARDEKIESKITASALEHQQYHCENEGKWGIAVWMRAHIFKSVLIVSIGLLLLFGFDNILRNDAASPIIKFVGKLIGIQ